jgi:hypothetical protein
MPRSTAGQVVVNPWRERDGIHGLAHRRRGSGATLSGIGVGR